MRYYLLKLDNYWPSSIDFHCPPRISQTLFHLKFKGHINKVISQKPWGQIWLNLAKLCLNPSYLTEIWFSFDILITQWKIRFQNVRFSRIFSIFPLFGWFEENVRAKFWNSDTKLLIISKRFEISTYFLFLLKDMCFQ